VLAKKDPIEQN